MNNGTLQWPVVIVYSLVLLAFLAAVVLTIVTAVKNRGKPKPDHLGNGNFIGYGPGGGRGPAMNGSPFGAPGAFAVPDKPKRPDEAREPDPRKR